MLYGRPTKHVRHVDEDDITLEPQRFYVHKFWQYHSSATARTDGQDLKDEKLYPLGSKIKKHKVDILVTPETIEPQQLYIGRLKLSFHDIYSHAMCGVHFEHASYQTTPSDLDHTNAITPHIFPNAAATSPVSGS